MGTKLIIVGGFLGAGKTTMLGQLAKKLSEEGKKVGLITNDQASGLVDTIYLQHAGGALREVSGSCFCCNFNGFVDAINALIDAGMDTIIAEPVGSCTDLSATIMQPLKEKMGDKLSIAPLSVMCDVNRVKDILAGGTSGLHKSAAYIVTKQMEEADFIVVNKKDLVSDEEIECVKEKVSHVWKDARNVFAVSALENSDIDSWLNAVYDADFAGTHILSDIDYDIYAEGEAVLGWLNAEIDLCGKDIDWGIWMERMMKELSCQFEAEGHAVGHMKAMITEPTNYVIANLVGNLSTLKVRGTSEKAEQAKLIFNARVEMSPDKLADAVKEKLEEMTGTSVSYEITEWNCLMPGRPDPTYRYTTVAK